MDAVSKKVTFSLLTILIVTGNGIILTVGGTDQKFRSKTLSDFTLSLALADFLVGCIVSTAPLIIPLLGDKSLSILMCRVCHYFEQVAWSVEVYAMLAFSVWRFAIIGAATSQSPTQRRKPRYIIATLWILCLLGSLNIPFTKGATRYPVPINAPNGTKGEPACTYFPHLQVPMILFDAIALYFLPAALQSALLVWCVFRIRKTTGPARPRLMRALVLMGTISVTFMILHAPYHIVLLLKIVGRIQVPKVAYQAAKVVAIANSFVNVFYYGLLNQDLKQSFLSKWNRKKVASSSDIVEPTNTTNLM